MTHRPWPSSPTPYPRRLRCPTPNSRRLRCPPPSTSSFTTSSPTTHHHSQPTTARPPISGTCSVRTPPRERLHLRLWKTGRAHALCSQARPPLCRWRCGVSCGGARPAWTVARLSVRRLRTVYGSSTRRLRIVYSSCAPRLRLIYGSSTPHLRLVYARVFYSSPPRRLRLVYASFARRLCSSTTRLWLVYASFRARLRLVYGLLVVHVCVVYGSRRRIVLRVLFPSSGSSMRRLRLVYVSSARRLRRVHGSPTRRLRLVYGSSKAGLGSSTRRLAKDATAISDQACQSPIDARRQSKYRACTFLFFMSAESFLYVKCFRRWPHLRL
jgi:hypothetical protein